MTQDTAKYCMNCKYAKLAVVDTGYGNVKEWICSQPDNQDFHQVFGARPRPLLTAVKYCDLFKWEPKA